MTLRSFVSFTSRGIILQLGSREPCGLRTKEKRKTFSMNFLLLFFTPSYYLTVSKLWILIYDNAAFFYSSKYCIISFVILHLMQYRILFFRLQFSLIIFACSFCLDAKRTKRSRLQIFNGQNMSYFLKEINSLSKLRQYFFLRKFRHF